MPTDNPRITFTVSEELKDEIGEYQHTNRIKNQSQAILALINKGMEKVERESAGAVTPSHQSQLSDDALRIARIYDELPDEHSKRLVRLVAEHERSRTHATAAPRTPSVPIVGELACDGSIEIKEAARRERKDEGHLEERTEELTPSPEK